MPLYFLTDDRNKNDTKLNPFPYAFYHSLFHVLKYCMNLVASGYGIVRLFPLIGKFKGFGTNLHKLNVLNSKELPIAIILNR